MLNEINQDMGKENPKREASAIRSTLAFRVINPELFIKPNKFVMGFGVLCFGACVLYLFNMNLNNEKRQTRFSIETGSSVEKSKWD